MLGVDSAAPGFRRGGVLPHPGKLARVRGSVPHPKGSVEVSVETAGANGFSAQIVLPPGVTGEFSWHGVTKELASGANPIKI